MGRSGGARAPGLSDSTGGIGDTLWQEWQRRNAGIGGRGIATELIPIPKLGGAGAAAADFRIDGPAAHGTPGLVHLYGIESPGLTAALAIGEHVAALLAAEGR